MSLPRSPQPPRTSERLDRPSPMTCSHCRASINRFAQIIRVDRTVVDTFGDQPNRVARATITDAAVFDSWPCVAGWIADRHP